MVAPWDRRSAAEHRRVEQRTLARWLPVAVSAAPFHRARAGHLDDRVLVDRTGLRRLLPVRARDLTGDSAGGAGAVLRPTEAQVKAFADNAVLARVVRAIGRAGAEGKRDALLHEYRPLQLHRAGPDGELLIASSRSDLDRWHRTGARAATVLGLDGGDVVVSAVPAGPTLDHLGAVHLAAGAGLTAVHARGADDDLTTVAAAFDQVPASAVVVAASDALDLALTLREARADASEVATVVVLGSPPDDQRRDEVVRAWRRLGADVRVLAAWGPSAGRSLWAECAPGSGLHTYPDLEVLEVVDPLTGAPTDGAGDLTLTGMGWHGTALVRFQTGTWVDPLTDATCPHCARTVPRVVGAVEPHAWELTAADGAGEPFHVDLRGVASVLATTRGVGAWRVELRDGDRGAHLAVDVTGALERDDARELGGRVAAATGAPVQITARVPDIEIERGIAAAGGILADVR